MHATPDGVSVLGPIVKTVSSESGHPLRVAVLNSADYAGGAENVARILLDGLSRRGHGVTFWVGRRRGETPDDRIRELPCSDSQRRVALRYARKGFFSLGLPSSVDFCESKSLSGTDLIHLHNLHGHYLSITALPRLARRFPLVWTFHDFFPVTGGCAFPYECDKWMSRCGSCPQRGRYPIASRYDRTRRMQAIKRKVFRDLPVTIVTPSKHLTNAVRRSGMFASAELHTIPYGVDTELFRPDRARARQSLGVPPDRPVVLLVAQGLNDPRKGLHHAIRALRQVDVPEFVVLLVGGGSDQPIVDALSRHDVRSLGYLTDRQQLADCYAASDLFVFTSLAENYPCVVQEAMASGTSVLAFDIDGVNEQITPDRTGFLVPSGDANRLARAIDQLLGNIPRLADVGAAARRHAEANWKLELFIDRHERLYRHVLSTRPR